MKSYCLAFVLLFSLLAPVSAQKKELALAKTNIKNGKDLDKAEASMRALLKDSANYDNMKIWHTLSESVRAQYEQLNEKVYLKEKLDTAKLFLTVCRMFKTYEAMDSVDAQPDKNGKVELKYRKRNADYLSTYLKNLYSGGVYLAGKQNYADAYTLFDTYLDCSRQPLFSGRKFDEKSKFALSSAYFAMYCGIRLGDNSKALKYVDLAVLYEPYRDRALQYVATIYNEENDTIAYLDYLKQGFEEFPESPYFFTRLVDYYNTSNHSDSALSVVDKGLKINSRSTLFMYAKSNIMLNTGNYIECISLCDSIISVDSTMVDAYYNAGVAYLNLAFESEKSGNAKNNKKAATGYYTKAKYYIEQYRAMAPDEKDKWASALYNIYLNLNLGKKFEEINRILQE